MTHLYDPDFDGIGTAELGRQQVAYDRAGDRLYPKVKSIPGPAWDACEDCLATGGPRDAHGEGSCGSCGGTGRRPANAAAREEVRRANDRRRDAIYERLERDADDERGRLDDAADELSERHANAEHAVALMDGCPDCEAAS